MTFTPAEQESIRGDIFRWLDERVGSGIDELTYPELCGYSYHGQTIKLMDQQPGIWNPKAFDETLSIKTTINGPYNDVVRDDGFVHYKYQSREGGYNKKLRLALDRGTPLIYFHGIRKGVYVATYPVYVVADDPANEEFIIALDEAMRFFGDPLHMTGDQRRYAERVGRQRLHQPVFRAQVLQAYDRACAICQLKHPDLLDAAHILPDTSAMGIPHVTNGMSLCKLHHAAYDRDLVGITPDFRVRINHQLLNEVDGPMLRHGLQDMHGKRISLPLRQKEWPSADGLAIRFRAFERKN